MKMFGRKAMQLRAAERDANRARVGVVRAARILRNHVGTAAFFFEAGRTVSRGGDRVARAVKADPAPWIVALFGAGWVVASTIQRDRRAPAADETGDPKAASLWSGPAALGAAALVAGLLLGDRRR